MTLPETWTRLSPRSAPSAGTVTVTWGATVSRVRAWERVRRLPAGSSATMVSVLAPSPRARPGKVKVPAVTVAAAPFTVTVTASSEAPLRGGEALAMTLPAAGLMPESTGGVRSMRNVRSRVAWLPAASVAVTARR